MMSDIEQLFVEGDFALKEAKSKFYLNKEEHCTAICSSCNAVKRYLDAYEKFLFEAVTPSENYHVLLHMIVQKDPKFKRFTGKIFEVKCFAEESKREGERFFLYADEMDEVLKIILELRTYIGSRVKLHKNFMEEYTETSFMTT
ncbi:hypothetical protein [Roseimarinus sediminis]|uniref:hypothetical protein n=1 Tax=Roseimarinus sediminis TaxID=1610899 RepID=UPI003D24636A